MSQQKNNSEKFYTISVVAKMLGVHQQTLRIYEKEGLIKPARTSGNTRLFTDSDIEELKLILRLTNELGVNLAGVGVILEMKHRMQEMEIEADERLKKVVEELTMHFFSYMQQNTCLPVLSYQQGLIIRQESNKGNSNNGQIKHTKT